MLFVFVVRLLEHNQITDVRPLGKSGNMEFLGLYVNGSFIQPTPLQPNLKASNKCSFLSFNYIT